MEVAAYINKENCVTHVRARACIEHPDMSSHVLKT